MASEGVCFDVAASNILSVCGLCGKQVPVEAPGPSTDKNTAEGKKE